MSDVTQITYDPEINDMLIRFTLLRQSMAWIEDNKEKVDENLDFVDSLQINLEEEMDELIRKLKSVYHEGVAVYQEEIQKINDQF